MAVVTSGPGVSNLTTGLATATSEGDPVLAIGGAVGRADLVKLTHQSMDTVSMLRPVTKYSAEIGAPAATSEIIVNAFRAAEGGRLGSAFVSTPMDVLGLPAGQKILADRKAPSAGPAPDSVIREAASLLKKAKKPAILLGMLASKPENSASICHFIRETGLPVVGCYQAAGTVSHDLLPQFGGRNGLFHNQYGDLLLQDSDVIIAIGYNPVEYDPSLWNRKSQWPIINIDVVPALLDNAYNPVVELIGDIALSVKALVHEVGKLGMTPEQVDILKAYRQAQKEDFARAKAIIRACCIRWKLSG